MDYANKLLRLELLYELAKQWTPAMYIGGEEASTLHRQICEVYGEVSDMFDEVIGRSHISVESGSGAPTLYPNLFEAGFLSGRSFHTHQGMTELLKVIGQIRQRVGSESHPNATPIWALIHPDITTEAKSRFNSDQFADSVEAAMKTVNARVKKIWISSGRDEKDGKQLMFAAFNPKEPVIRLSDLSTESGRNIQEGYMHLFAGAIQGIRNPKAHDNLNISPERAVHFLMFASLLMSKLDEAGLGD